ncbi:MAG: PKD-like domain-containing protein, partial [Bacteroidota bacterium]
TVCSGSTFTVTPNNLANGIVPAGTTYSWGYPVVGPAMTGGAAGTNTTSISGTLVNATTIAQIATYTVTPKSGSCVGSSFTVTVTVNPIPAITNMSAIVCSGSTFTVTPTDVTSGVIPTGTTYSWVAPNLPSGLGGAAAGNGTTITGSLINSTNSPLNAIYTVIPSAGGCVGSPFTVTITVNPAPVAPIVNSPISYCLSTTSAQLTAIGTNLLWYTTATGGTGSSTPPTPSTATLGTTYYYVSQTVNGCESARALITVTVSSTAEAPIVTNIAYCQYSTSAPLTAIATGTLLWYSTATGGTGSANAPIPPTMVVGSINYYVSQTINGCASPRDTIIVFIYPTPSAPMISDPGLLCQNTIANPLTATGTNLLWYTTATGGIGSTIAPIPSTTFVGTTNYYVSQTVNGCEGPRAVIVVTVNLAPSITNISDTICNGAPFLVTPLNGVNGIVPVGTTYSWTIPTTSGIDGFQGGNNAINISGTLSNNPNSVSHTATYIVTPKLGSCVGDTFTVKVVVTTSQAPLTPGVIYGPDPVCQGQGPIQYLIAPLTYATSYVWTIPIGVIGSSTTSSINVSFSTSIQSAPIKVKGYNSYCGFGGEAILVVDVQNCIGVDVFTGDGGISISPNPVSGLSNLKIKLTSDQQLNICIYDITGRKVIEVLNAQKQRGEHHVQIDATDLKAGIYLIKAIGVESFETVKFSVTH